MSRAARKRIAMAQKKRWAAVREAKAEPKKSKRKLSAAGRKAIIAATKKRWAAVRKAAAKNKKVRSESRRKIGDGGTASHVTAPHQVAHAMLGWAVLALISTKVY